MPSGIWHMGVNYLLPVLTTAQASATLFWFNVFPDLEAQFPYLIYSPDPQSQHRCSTHEDLFNVTFTHHHPQLGVNIPANGWNCKCRLAPSATPAGPIWPEDKPLEPVKEYDEFKPYLPHDPRPADNPFPWMDDDRLAQLLTLPTLLYDKHYSTLWVCPANFSFSGKASLETYTPQDVLDGKVEPLGS